MPIPVGDQNPRRTARNNTNIVQQLQSFLPKGPLFGGGGGGGQPDWMAFLGKNPGGGSGVPSSQQFPFRPGTSALESLLIAPLLVGGRNLGNRPGAGRDAGGGGDNLSPVQIALAQLDQLVNTGMQFPQGPSEADLQQALDEAAAGIQKSFGAQIGAIQAQNAGARKDTRQGSRAVRRMYNQLGNSYNRMGQKQFKQGSKLAHQLGKMGEREGDIISDQGQDIARAGAQGAAALGLGDLAKQLVHETRHDAGNLAEKAVRQGGMAAQTEKRIGANNRTFMQTSGQASRLEGTNTAADMVAQLQDYLQQNRSAIAALAGEREAAIAAAQAGVQSSFADAQADYADMRSDARQDLIDNKMDLLKLALDIQSDQRDNRSSSSAQSRMEKFYDMLPEQVAGPAQILNKFGDNEVSSLYEKLSGRGSMQRGFTGSREQNTDQTLQGNFANMQDWVSDVIGNQAWAGLSTAQRNALVSALLAQLEGMAG